MLIFLVFIGFPKVETPLDESNALFANGKLWNFRNFGGSRRFLQPCFRCNKRFFFSFCARVQLFICFVAESTEFWQSFLLPDVQEYFGKQNDLEFCKDFKSFLMSQSVIEESPALRLFVELSKKCSLHWGSLLDYYKAQVRLQESLLSFFEFCFCSQPHLLTLLQSPFGYGDLSELPVEVTHLPVLLFAKVQLVLFSSFLFLLLLLFASSVSSVYFFCLSSVCLAGQSEADFGGKMFWQSLFLFELEFGQLFCARAGCAHHQRNLAQHCVVSRPHWSASSR